MTDPRVGVIMGSDSDWPVMEAAAEALAEFDVPFEVGVVSAHRTPGRMLASYRSRARSGPTSPRSYANRSRSASIAGTEGS